MKIVPLISIKFLLPHLLLGFLVFNSLAEAGAILSPKENDVTFTSNHISSDLKENSSVSREGSGRSLLLKSLILAPLGLTLLALVAIALLPIPAITIPAGRSYVSNFYQGSSRLAKLAKDVLTSDSCVERVSCEISRTIKHYGVPADVHKLVSRVLPVNNQWKERMSRGFDNSGSDCAIFSCGSQLGLNVNVNYSANRMKN